MKESAKQKSIMSLYPYPLKKIGQGLWRGQCPFHDDTTFNNFTIYPQTNTFHCFACNKSGDVITFYMLLNNCDFKAALEELA